MTTNKTQTDDQNIEIIEDKLNVLLKEAEALGEEINATSNDANRELDAIETRVDETINEVEEIYSSLDQMEKDAGDELDKIILEQAEDEAND